MWWELFVTFFKIGLASYGGGYAMIPVIEHEVTRHGWMTAQQLTDVIAVAGMAPGPIAANSAIFVGYHLDGVTGAVAALLGMVSPSLLCVLFLATLFARWHRHPFFAAVFYGLRPVLTGLILYAAVRFARANGLFLLSGSHAGALLFILGLSLFLLFRFHLHPAWVMLLSGMLGVFFFH
jgi:chromate transporter